MQGRGRGQLPPFHRVARFLLRDSSTASSTIASVTYDDPNGWESWEPGATWGNGSGADAPNNQDPGTGTRESESELLWDEDGDTILRHPKQLPRTLITTSELDWEDSEEVATELWLHPQRRSARADTAQQRLPARGLRSQPAPETGRARGTGRTTSELRPTVPRQEPRVPQTSPRAVEISPRAADTSLRAAELSPRAAEATLRAAEVSPRAADTSLRAAQTGPRPTQSGARAAEASSRAAPVEPRVPQPDPGPAVSLPPRSAEPTARWRSGAPQRLPAAPPPRAAEPLPERRERTITQPGAAASSPPPPQRLPAAPQRSLNQTQVSGFGAAPTRSDTPAPGSIPRQAPAIESLRGKLEATQRILPPPRPQSGHIPTILGTPAAGSALVPRSTRLPPTAAMLPPGPASTSVQAAAIEHLQEQLLEAMARARVQEARAAEAEKSVEQVEEQLESIVRSHMAESEQLQEQLRLLSEQLRVSEVRTGEAERRSRVVPRPSNMLHLSEVELPPRASKQSRANLILSGLLASSLSFGGAAYFMFYAPLQKQLAALEQQRVQDAQAQAIALTNLKAQSNAERQGAEVQASELRAQLEAARAEAAAASNPEEGRRGSRLRRGSSADADSEDAPVGTRSARAIERRMRRSRSAAPADDQPAPARSGRSSRDNGDDPLGGI